MRHAKQAQCISQCANDDDAKSTIAVGQHAGENADQTPADVLHGYRHGKVFTAPAHGLGHGLHP